MLEYVTSLQGQFTKAHNTDAAYDIISAEDITVFPKSRQLISTDLRLGIPEGWVGVIKARSGLSSKHCLDVGAGVIDPGYTGEVKVLLINNGEDWYKVRAGDKIAQILILPCYPDDAVEQVFELKETRRGSNGFNSTGY